MKYQTSDPSGQGQGVCVCVCVCVCERERESSYWPIMISLVKAHEKNKTGVNSITRVKKNLISHTLTAANSCARAVSRHKQTGSH